MLAPAPELNAPESVLELAPKLTIPVPAKVIAPVNAPVACPKLRVAPVATVNKSVAALNILVAPFNVAEPLLTVKLDAAPPQ